MGEADRCSLLTGHFQTALLHSRLQDENGSTYNNVSHTELVRVDFACVYTKQMYKVTLEWTLYVLTLN